MYPAADLPRSRSASDAPLAKACFEYARKRLLKLIRRRFRPRHLPPCVATRSKKNIATIRRPPAKSDFTNFQQGSLNACGLASPFHRARQYYGTSSSLASCAHRVSHTVDFYDRRSVIDQCHLYLARAVKHEFDLLVSAQDVGPVGRDCRQQERKQFEPSVRDIRLTIHRRLVADNR